VEGFPDGKVGLCVYKGLAENSGIYPIDGKGQALCAGSNAEWRLEDGGHGCGCGGWLASILEQIRDKAAELDRLLLFAIHAVEAGRPGHRLRLLPLRARRTAIAFETSKLLQELEEVVAKW
jgi:hypothetical protein